MQLDLNLRSIILFYRECADLLRAAGAEHKNALVVNTASIAGKSRPAVAVGLQRDEVRRRRLDAVDEQGAQRRGHQVARAVPRRSSDTPMTEFIRDQVPAEEMIRTADVAEAGALRCCTLTPGVRDPRDHLTAERLRWSRRRESRELGSRRPARRPRDGADDRRLASGAARASRRSSRATRGADGRRSRRQVGLRQ